MSYSVPSESSKGSNSMIRRLLPFIATLIFVVLCLGYLQCQDVTMTRQIRELESVAFMRDVATVTASSGEVFAIPRNPGETAKAWAERAERIVSGVESMSNYLCETIVCPAGMIRICVQCQPGESEAECQARLDEAVEAFCTAFNCDCD